MATAAHNITTRAPATPAPAHINERFLRELTTLRSAIDNLIADTRRRGYDDESAAYRDYLLADYAVNEQIEIWDRARSLDTFDPDAALYAAADRGYAALALVREG